MKYPNLTDCEAFLGNVRSGFSQLMSGQASSSLFPRFNSPIDLKHRYFYSTKVLNEHTIIWEWCKNCQLTSKTCMDVFASRAYCIIQLQSYFLSFRLQLTTLVENNISIICITYGLISFEVKTFFSFFFCLFLYCNAKWKAAVLRNLPIFLSLIKLPFHRYGRKHTIQQPNNNNNMLCTCKALHWYHGPIIYPPTLFACTNGIL